MRTKKDINVMNVNKCIGIWYIYPMFWLIILFTKNKVKATVPALRLLPKTLTSLGTALQIIKIKECRVKKGNLHIIVLLF